MLMLECHQDTTPVATFIFKDNREDTRARYMISLKMKPKALTLWKTYVCF